MHAGTASGTGLRLYYAAVFAALGVYLPFFPRWLEARGIEGIEMGLVTATVPAMGLLGPPAFGLAADAFGLRGGLLRLASSAACLSFGTIAAASLLGRPLGFGALLLAMLVGALARSVLVMLGDVAAMEHSRATGKSYGAIRLWGSLGFLLAALGTGRWIDPQGPAGVPLAVAASLLVGAAVTWTMPARSPVPAAPDARGAHALIGARDFRLFLGTYFLSQMAHTNYDLCFSLHTRDLGADGDWVGRAWAFGVVCEVVLMAKAETLLGRFQAQHLALFAIAGAVLRWALIAKIRSLPWLFALQPLHVLSFGLLWIASIAWIRNRAPLQALATAQGLFSASAAAGSVLGMLVWSSLYRGQGGTATFGLAALVAAAALGLAAAWARSQHVTAAPPS
jgi:MFS transporter, PPP family, 3-phenylpropionic acid transporter